MTTEKSNYTEPLLSKVLEKQITLRPQKFQEQRLGSEIKASCPDVGDNLIDDSTYDISVNVLSTEIEYLIEGWGKTVFRAAQFVQNLINLVHYQPTVLIIKYEYNPETDDTVVKSCARVPTAKWPECGYQCRPCRYESRKIQDIKDHLQQVHDIKDLADIHLGEWRETENCQYYCSTLLHPDGILCTHKHARSDSRYGVGPGNMIWGNPSPLLPHWTCCCANQLNAPCRQVRIPPHDDI